jgi:hypothetical protein
MSSLEGNIASKQSLTGEVSNGVVHTGGITTELDPTVPEHVKNITIGDIENWNNVDELENVLRNILEAIQSGVSASMVIEEIEQLIVEYFENKTVEEVEA